MATKRIQITSQPESRVKPEPRLDKIICIDDNDIDLFINEAILKAVSLAREIKRELNPANVLSQLEKAERLSDIPELIFLDLVMDKMNGFGFLEEFNKLSDFIRNKCKIVVVTSSHNKDDKFKALLNPSVIRYLVKPLDVCHLKDFMLRE